jgi:hypothetical protein
VAVAVGMGLEADRLCRGGLVCAHDVDDFVRRDGRARK